MLTGWAVEVEMMWVVAMYGFDEGQSREVDVDAELSWMEGGWEG